MDCKKTVNDYIKHLTTLNYAPGTIRNIKQDIYTFLRYLDKRQVIDIRSITREDILEYGKQIRQSGISPYSRQRKIRVVKQLFARLKETKNFFIDPTEGIPIPKTRQSLPKDILTIEEMKRMLRIPNTGFPEGVRDRALLELLWSTGIRAHEITSITLEDIDITEGHLLIREGKGKKDRVVPVGKTAVQRLNEYITHVRPHCINPKIPETALFISINGEKLSSYWVNAVIKASAQQAKIKKKITSHSIRHSMATHLLSAGADIQIVQHILGHKRLETTTIYTRVVPVDVKETHRKSHPRER